MKQHKSKLLSSTVICMIAGAGLAVTGAAASAAVSSVTPQGAVHAEMPDAVPYGTQVASCNPCNPCASACNPCNPCASACNPCQPKKVCNPCNPCAAANPCNPCNPCAAD